MKKQCMVFAMVAMCVSLCVSVGAQRAAAQGPAGVGAGAAAADSSHTPHSYNPINWVKKNPKTASEQLDASSEQGRKLTANLQAQGVLAANMDLKGVCLTFRELGDCLAALHASHTLGLEFGCLKADLTGVMTSADMSSCKGTAGSKAMSLSNAIHAMKPQSDAKTEAKNAEKQAQEDLKQAGA